MKVRDIISEVAGQQQTVPGVQPTMARGARTVSVNAEIIMRRIDRYKVTTPISKTVVNTRAEKILGGYLTIVKYLNLFTFAYQFYEDYIAIEAMVQNGELPAEDEGTAKRLVAERMVVSMMASGVILRVIQYFFRMVLIGKTLSKVAAAGVTIFTAGIIAPGAIALILAQEAASLALQQWLSTEDGRKTVAYIVVHLFDPTMKFLWDMGPGKFVGKLKGLSTEGEKAMDKKGLGPGDIEDKAKQNADAVIAKGKGDSKKIDATTADPNSPSANSPSAKTTPPADDDPFKGLGWYSSDKGKNPTDPFGTPLKPKKP